jgi:hypothetical protein
VGRERKRGRWAGPAQGGTCWHGEEGEAAGWDRLQREREPTDRRARSRKSKFKTDSNLTLSKTGVPGLKKSKIKYGYEGFKEGNNFLHRNFLRFELYFELKIWEVKV